MSIKNIQVIYASERSEKAPHDIAQFEPPILEHLNREMYELSLKLTFSTCMIL